MLKSKCLPIYFFIFITLFYKSEEEAGSAGEQPASNRIYGCENTVGSFLKKRLPFLFSLPEIAKKTHFIFSFSMNLIYKNILLSTDQSNYWLYCLVSIFTESEP